VIASDDIGRLIGLGLVALVAVGAVWLLLRLSERRGPRGAPALGYPPDGYPAQELIRSGPLAELAAVQARLSALALRLPPQSDQRIWLQTFLDELRQIMDTAYRAALIAQVYGQPAGLERLVAEVRQIEAEAAANITRRLLARESDAHDELLDGRLAALRLCAHELAGLAAAHSSSL
jgi:hypothetical protein